MQKRKKRRVKGDSRLSFIEEIENESDEENMEKSWVHSSLQYSLYIYWS